MLKVVEVKAKKTVYNGMFKFEEGVVYPVRNSRDGSKVLIREAKGKWIVLANRHGMVKDNFKLNGIVFEDLFDEVNRTYVSDWKEMNSFLNSVA